MAVQKLSQIVQAGSPPALTDFVVGVSSGAVDLLYTLAQVQSTVGIITITVNSTTISGGTSGHVVFDNAGTFGEAANFTISSGNPNVTSGNAYLYNTVVAVEALTAIRNWYFAGAGNLSTTAQDDLGIGVTALSSVNAGVANNGRNVAIGNNALQMGTTVEGNVAIGWDTLSTTTNATGCVALGEGSMSSATGGTGNVGIGHSTLAANTSGSFNSALGSGALQNNTSGGGNSADGSNCLQHNTIGVNNFGMGTQALQQNIDGGNNVGIGFQSLNGMDHGNSNIVIGSQSMDSLITNSNRNTGLGGSCGRGLSSGADNNNTFIGFAAGNSITAGNGNTVIGANIPGPAGTVSNTISIGTGGAVTTGTVQLDFSVTNANVWTFNQNIMFASSQTLNNGAGTGSGVTFTNAPGASGATGNPTKWIQINDNGTTRYIPAF